MGNVNVGGVIAAGLVFNSSLTPFSGGGTLIYEKIVKNALSGMLNTEAKIADYLKKTKPPTCFVAGTLVWTDKGKVPIEQLKVGDMVLSKHENNTGEQSYKPVTRTFVHEDEVIQLLHADSKTVPNTAPGASSGPIAEKFRKYGIWEHFICVTPNHPFYVTKNAPSVVERFNVPSEGWTEIKYVSETASSYLQLADGSYKHGGLVREFWKTDEPTIGWAPYDDSWQAPGYFFDISPDQLTEVSKDRFYRGLPPTDYTESYTPMRATVYNIEVADFHTYYVGDLGFWVHNKNDPFDNRVLAEAQAKALKGDDTGRIFYVIEKPLDLTNSAHLFESQTHGYYQLEGKVIPPAIEYRTPFSSGDNYITADSLALMPNGKPSAMLMDAKSGRSVYVTPEPQKMGSGSNK